MSAPAESPYQLRQRIRRGQHQGNTSGLAAGFVQCNLAILPVDYADEFLRFCQLNPRPCPLIAVSSKPGEFMLPEVGEDVDIRTDVPAYQLFEKGEPTRQVQDLSSHWRDDLVTFMLGCSFSFEEALLADGLEIRNISEKVNVPMYRTSLPCKQAGRFSGNMVVSMRPMKPADAIRAIQICSRFPAVHGAPVHFGDPAQIGISDINQPDFGDAVSIHEGEVPVFWACGVTPQLAIREAKPPFCITHSPGCMLVTDLLNSKLSVF
ncbi:putative hydro-lyase [Bowmanella dokdonensis]|nr:putative hydro-lyase [Bowmanella dokdonensis]